MNGRVAPKGDVYPNRLDHRHNAIGRCVQSWSAAPLERRLRHSGAGRRRLEGASFYENANVEFLRLREK